MSCGLGCPLHRKELNWAMTVEKNCSASPGRRVELDRPCRNGAFFPLGAGLESSLPLLADAAWLLCLGELPGGPFCRADALRKRLLVQRKPRGRTSPQAAPLPSQEWLWLRCTHGRVPRRDP